MTTILIVDDRPTNRELLVAMLGHRGHRLIEAGDGVEALHAIRAEHPDLVITDLLMPTMDGYELVRQIRADPSIADTRVMFYTAHYREHEAEALARSCGVAKVIIKPAEPQVVIEAVDAVLKRPLATAKAPVAADFEREHARVLTDKLSGTVDELQHTNARLSALIELSLQLGSELDPSRLLNHFCEATREIIGARQAIAGMVHVDDHHVRQLFTAGMDAETAALLGSPDPKLPILKSVVSGGRSARLQNPGGNPAELGFSASFPPINSWLAAPIVSPTRVYGWLGLIDKVGADGFTEEDERLATILAAQVGRIYQNGSLYAEALRHASELEIEVAERERAEQRQAILLAVGQALAESRTLPEAARRVLEAMGKGLAFDAGSLWMIDGATSRLRTIEQWQAGSLSSAEWESATRSLTLARGQSLAGRVWDSGEPQWAPDFAGDERFVRASLASRLGLRASFAFPILFEGQVLGVVEFFGRSLREPDADLLQMFAGVGAPLGQYIERDLAEQAMRHAKRRLEHVVTSSPAVLFTLAFEGAELNPTWMSANIEEILGWRMADVFIKDWWLERLHPEDAARVVAEIERRLSTDGRCSDEYRFLHADGSYRWMRSDMRLVRNEAEGLTKVVGSWLDITERRLLEDQFRQAQKMEAVGRLAGGVAHDFNNIVTVINCYSEIVANQLRSGDPLRPMVEQIGKAGARAANLTRQLLAFSRKQVLQPVVLDVNVLVRDMENMLRRLIGEDIELTVVPGAGVWRVRTDPGQLEQVIMNVVINARDAMPQGGKLTIETDNVTLDEAYAQQHAGVSAGAHIRVAITDSGSGMDLATKARIFEPFFSTKGEKGTGLGLATVFGIVKQSGGHVEVYTEVGVGTTFKIYLPREATNAAAQVQERPQAVQGGSETILVVEDEDDVRKIIVMILKGQGYEVIETANGGEALLASEQARGPIHLLLTDVVMPNMSGRQLAERLDSLSPGLRVLYLSGYTDDAIVHHGVLEAGVAFLNKPFTWESLSRKVREVLDKPKG